MLFQHLRQAAFASAAVAALPWCGSARAPFAGEIRRSTLGCFCRHAAPALKNSPANVDMTVVIGSINYCVKPFCCDRLRGWEICELAQASPAQHVAKTRDLRRSQYDPLAPAPQPLGGGKRRLSPCNDNERTRAEFGGRALFKRIVVYSCNKPLPFPNFDVVAVDKLAGLVRGFLIVSTFDDFRWPRNVPGSVDKKDAIRRHDSHSSSLPRNGYSSGPEQNVNRGLWGRPTNEKTPTGRVLGRGPVS